MSDKVGQVEDRPKKLKKSFRLQDSVITSLEVLADRRNISLSKMVEDVLSDYIDGKEEFPELSDKVSDTSDRVSDRSNDGYMAFLQEQIRVKDAQIADLQISLNKALDAAQGLELLQLQAGREDVKEDPAADSIVVDVDSGENKETKTVENIADSATDSPYMDDVTNTMEEQAEQSLMERIRAYVKQLFG